MASSLKRETHASSASAGRANMLHPHRIENIWQGYRTGDITLLRRGVRALQKSLASLYARLKAAERKLQGDLLGATCQLSALRIHSKMLIGPNIQFVCRPFPNPLFASLSPFLFRTKKLFSHPGCMRPLTLYVVRLDPIIHSSSRQPIPCSFGRYDWIKL